MNAVDLFADMIYNPEKQSRISKNVKVIKLKVKPSHYQFLNRSAVETNIAWNQLNEIYNQHVKEGEYISHFDLNKLCIGWAKAHFKDSMQMTFSCVSREIVARSRQHKKRLRSRLNYGSHRALGWIPFTADCLRKNGATGLKFKGHSIRVFESSKLAAFKSHKDWRESCFTQDSVGDWYLCLTVDQKNEWPAPINSDVGIDIGLKTSAVCSNGEQFESRFYRDSEKKLANLQRRGHKKQAKRLHRKIARQRRHAAHVFTTNLIKQYQNLYIGDVDFIFLKNAKNAKSAYDGASSMIKSMLAYKGQQAMRHVKIINEAYTTQACSACGCLSGPTGRTGLVVREWQCGECGASHDRDINAAINICHLGMKHHPPSAGTSQKFSGHVQSATSASTGHGFMTRKLQA